MPPESTNPWPRLLDDVRRYVRRRVADPGIAEDLVQDTLTKLATRLHTAPMSMPLHAWALRVARNAIVDHYRTRRTAGAAVEDMAEDDPRLNRIEREGLLASFRAFVHALPAEQREAVLLTEYDGMTQADVAARLGVPVSTVKSRVQRGRKRLQQALQECCTFEFDRRGNLVDWQRRHETDRPDCRGC